MRKFIYFIFCMITIIQISCKDKKMVNLQNGGNDDGTIDITTMATPNGGKLKSAQDGPIRSALGQPKIDLTTFTLEITGLVDSSLSFNWEEINRLPAVFSDTMLMYCVEGWEVWGDWKGILVKDLLDKAHVQGEGKYILFGGVDGYTTALPISYLEKYNAMLAYQVNDSLLKEHDGFPLRLVAFGKYGYKWAKWVTSLEVLNQSQVGYWEGYGYPDRADVPIERRRYYEGSNANPLDY
jgi:DMSO/TMAO reductase YedYZ molybdopterin-dependent catalytic subunit